VLLTITPKAARLLERLTTVQAPVNDALFRRLSEDDFTSLRQTVSQLVETGNDALQLLDERDGKKRRLARRGRT
jgi:hypothetical protein